jgi:hypothetical protein
LLPPAFFAELGDALIVSHQRAAKVDRRGDQKPVRRIAVFKMMKLVAASGGAMRQRYALEAWPIKKTVDPRIHGNVEFDPSRIDKQGDFPDRDGAEPNSVFVVLSGVEAVTVSKLYIFLQAIPNGRSRRYRHAA